MFTPQQLEYFESQAIQRAINTLSNMLQPVRELQGDILATVPDVVKELWVKQGKELSELEQIIRDEKEASYILMFTELAQAFAGLSQAIAALRIGDSSLIDQIIPPVPPK